jgi:hypothetical protein
VDALQFVHIPIVTAVIASRNTYAGAIAAAYAATSTSLMTRGSATLHGITRRASQI